LNPHHRLRRPGPGSAGTRAVEWSPWGKLNPLCKFRKLASRATRRDMGRSAEELNPARPG